MTDSARLSGETKGSRRMSQSVGQPRVQTSRIPNLDPAIASWFAAMLSGLPHAANDTAAATAGVAIGGMYRNGSVLMVRVA